MILNAFMAYVRVRLQPVSRPVNQLGHVLNAEVYNAAAPGAHGHEISNLAFHYAEVNNDQF